MRARGNADGTPGCQAAAALQYKVASKRLRPYSPAAREGRGRQARRRAAALVSSAVWRETSGCCMRAVSGTVGKRLWARSRVADGPEGRSRTSDTRIYSPLLWPAELPREIGTCPRRRAVGPSGGTER